MRPRAGLRYPSSAGEFRSWFGTDEDCLDYLDWLRWPEGFVGPCCGQAGGWWVADGRYKCPGGDGLYRWRDQWGCLLCHLLEGERLEEARDRQPRHCVAPSIATSSPSTPAGSHR